ncbi:MAG: hypothetical protein ACI4Q4_04800 [Oscillospiraceae bacterium]
MEIKGISGVINAYQTNKPAAPKKTAASDSVKKTDRVTFGFDTALAAAKNAIAQEVRADASVSDIAAAQQTAEEGIGAAELASLILMG